MATHDLYLAHRDVIERALTHICRRHNLTAVDAEDFASSFRLHLMEGDYAIVRSFSGRSSLHTYLLVVVAHYFQDWRNAKWGKWRPSSEARRLGNLAVRLEQLTVRDGLTLDEAYETLRTNFGMPVTRESLEELRARFPSRSGRTIVTDDVLDARPAGTPGPDAEAQRRDAVAAAERSSRALSGAVAGLAAQDRLVLRMRFEDGLSVADIARSLQLDQKALYRRFDRMLADLRSALEAVGLTATIAGEALIEGGFDLMAVEPGNHAPGVRHYHQGVQSPQGTAPTVRMK